MVEDVSTWMSKCKDYWNQWFETGHIEQLASYQDYERTKANLVAMKCSLMNGFVPADLTGHYFANSMPCYYARDAMMTARGFLMAGYYKEFVDVFMYLKHRKKKANGEFYQRYNGLGNPDEGANNNVFHQLDSIGFFFT